MEEVEKQVKRYIWLAIILCVLIAILIVWRAMIKLNYKMHLLRDNFWSVIKILFWIGVVIFIIVMLIVAVLNYYSREKIQLEKKDTDRS